MRRDFTVIVFILQILGETLKFLRKKKNRHRTEEASILSRNIRNTFYFKEHSYIMQE